MTSPLGQPSTVQEKPEECVTPVAEDMEIQLPATDKRAVGTVHDCEMEDGNKRPSVPGQLVEWKCACWMTIATNDAGRAATSTCHGDDSFVEASLEGLGKAETTLRNHFETKRLDVVGPGRC